MKEVRGRKKEGRKEEKKPKLFSSQIKEEVGRMGFDSTFDVII